MNQFEEWVIQNHELKWKGRLERLKWIEYNRPRFERGHLLRSGHTGFRLRNEAMCCFIDGHYLATTLLSLSFIEHQLSALLYGSGNDDAVNYSAYKSIEKSHKQRIITREEKELFHRVRKARNPIAHFQPPMNEYSVIRQAIDRNTAIVGVVKKDAKIALQAMFRVVSKLGVGRKISKTMPAEHHPNQTYLNDFV